MIEGDMRIQRDEAGLSWNEVAALFTSVGWDFRDPDELEAAFERSTFKAFAFEGDELIGFGRTIDDGRFYATIVDVIVSPAHQGRGVGRAIVQDLQSRLKGFIVVTLTAAKDVAPFYTKLGWRSASTGMIWPRSSEQAEHHCPGQSSDGEEQHLSGGFVNRVVRVGDTVRRAAGPWTATIHRLLTHVRAKGISWVPEPHGLDTLGREVLSFIPGDVPHEMPAWVWSESVLAEVGRALRQWHDATVDFDVAGAIWNFTTPGPNEVICHNDFAPYNCVFRNGQFAGAIDFDFCAPGPRIWDLAYLAYRFVPLMPDASFRGDVPSSERSPFPRATMALRLKRLLDEYASADSLLPIESSRVVTAAADRLDALAIWTEEHVRANGILALEAHAAMYREHARWLRSWPGTG